MLKIRGWSQAHDEADIEVIEVIETVTRHQDPTNRCGDLGAQGGNVRHHLERVSALGHGRCSAFCSPCHERRAVAGGQAARCRRSPSSRRGNGRCRAVARLDRVILIQPLLHVGVRGHRDLRAPGDRVPAELEDMATDLSRANTDAMERI